MNKKLSAAMFLAVIALLAKGSYTHALDVSVTATTSVQASGSMDATANVNAYVSSSAGGPDGQMASGTMMIMDNNTVPLIQTTSDLDTYNAMVVKMEPAVAAVKVQSNNTVSIDYSQPAKFLGIFSTSLSGRVDVDAQGNTTVHLPWWSFLYAKDTTAIQASVSTAVQHAGISFGAQANAGSQLQNTAEIVNAAAAAIQASASANASATTGY